MRDEFYNKIYLKTSDPRSELKLIDYFENKINLKYKITEYNEFQITFPEFFFRPVKKRVVVMLNEILPLIDSFGYFIVDQGNTTIKAKDFDVKVYSWVRRFYSTIEQHKIDNNGSIYLYLFNYYTEIEKDIPYTTFNDGIKYIAVKDMKVNKIANVVFDPTSLYSGLFKENPKIERLAYRQINGDC